MGIKRGPRYKVRMQVFARDKWACVFCGYRPPQFLMPGRFKDLQYRPGYNILTIDHIVPKRNGGDNKQSNLRTLCYECHTKLNKSEGFS